MRRKTITVFLMISIAGLLCIEATFRYLWNIPLLPINFASENLISEQRIRPTKYDPELGWIPRPQFSGKIPAWGGAQLTLGEDGIRSNGNVGPLNGSSTYLAVGDSFTLGDEVEDTESWPSQLERATHVNILNAGVFGYGLDQTYLRLFQLYEKYQPKGVILGFIPHDIERMKKSWAIRVSKPYFELKADELELHKEHLHAPILDPRKHFMRTVLDVSVTANLLFKRLGSVKAWFYTDENTSPEFEDGEVERIACKLLKQLSEWSKEKKVTTYVVMISDDMSEAGNVLFEELLPCAREPLRVVQTYDYFRKQGFDEASFTKLKKHHHLNAQGNKLIADVIAESFNAAPPDKAKQKLAFHR